MSACNSDPEPFGGALTRIDARPSRLMGLIRVALRAGAWLCGFRIAVQGLNHLPRGTDGRIAGGWILAGAPHRAWVDPLLLVVAWPADAPRLVWLGDGPTLVRSWWRRLLLPRLGVIPIMPGAGPAALASHVEAAGEVLSRGAVLALFVERGAPSPPDRTREIAGGFAWIARAAGAPVVPVVIGGAQRIIRGSPFIVRFLAPLPRPPAAPPPAAVPREADRPAALDRTRRPPATSLDSAWRPAAEALVTHYRREVAGPIREVAAWADDRAPSASRWPWLATLFR